MNISSIASQVASTVTEVASAAVNMAAQHLDIHEVDREAFQNAGDSPVKNDHLVIHAFHDPKSKTMRAITAPNNWYGKTLQFIFGAHEQIATAVAKDLQLYKGTTTERLAALTQATKAYATLSQTPMITAEVVRETYADTSHDISVEDSSGDAQKKHIVSDDSLSETGTAENSDLEDASDEQTALLSQDVTTGQKEPLLNHDVTTEQSGLLTHDSLTTSTDALLEPDTVITTEAHTTLEKTEEVNSLVSSQPTATTHVETALKEVHEALALQKTDQPTTLLNSFSKMLESFALKLEELKKLIGTPGKKVLLKQKMYNLFAEVEKSNRDPAWPVAQKPLLENIKKSLFAAQEAVIKASSEGH